MNVFAWIVLAYFALGILININRVGKVRVKTPAQATWDAIEYALLGLLVVLAVLS